jgi:putative ABC transport system permease protein
MFMTGLNTAKAWSLRLQEVTTGRKYDVAVRLQRPEPVEKAIGTVGAVSGVADAEAWGLASASWGDSRGVPVVRTYPDKGHGSFQVVGTPANTKLVDFPVLAGRWLEPEDDEVTVLNHMAAADAPQAEVGGVVTISVEGVTQSWRVVGFVRDLGSPATAYIPWRTFERISRTPGTTQLLGVSTAARDSAARAEVIRRVERAVEGAGMEIDVSVPVEVLSTAVGEHMAVLLGLILGLAGLMSLVGVLGLTAAMSMGVLERTRELGVMQAVGAAPAQVLRVILAEGVFVGAFSGLLAVASAVPLSALVGTVVGGLSFRAPLSLVMSPAAVLSWLAIVIAFSAVATAAPALSASRMSVREALAYN